MQSAVYLINMISSTALSGKSPFEVFYDRKPNLQHLRFLGYLCYATRIGANTDKFDAKVEKAVHLRYFSTQKGYKLYSLTNHIMFVSIDIVFWENVFPFSSLAARGTFEPVPSSQAADAELFVSIPVTDNAQVDHSGISPTMVEPVESSVECSPTTHPASVHSEPACPVESPVPFTPAATPTTSIKNTDAPPIAVSRSSRPSKTPGWLHGLLHQVAT